MTGEDLEYKPEVVEKVKFEYSQLGEALNNKVKSKTDQRNKIAKTDKQDKNLVYNSQYSFVKFKDISDFKEMSLDFMHKRLHNFHKKFTRLKNIRPKTRDKEDLRANVLENGGDLFNELHCIYKERCVEEKHALNKKDMNKSDYTKCRLTDNYLFESEKEEKQTDKKPDKKNHLKNQK